MIGFVLFFIFVSPFPFPSHLSAYEEFAAQTGKDCEACHRSPMGGPDLTRYGEAFRRGKYQYPIPTEAFEKPPWLKKIIFFAIGYIHFVAGIVWFGTIFYVHIIIKPQTLTKGLPRSELILGWVCIIALGSTGILLTIARINSFSQLYTTKFGIILSAKVILFLMMVSIAAITTFVIRKKLGGIKRQEADESHSTESFTHTELLSFNGTDQHPAYIAVNGEVYDVSESPAWKEGRHMGQHFPGRDLTDALSAAPHGPEVLAKYKKVGRLWQGKMEVPRETTGVRKAFLFLSYCALVIMFLIILCLALWRWG